MQELISQSGGIPSRLSKSTSKSLHTNENDVIWGTTIVVSLIWARKSQ